MVKIETCSTVLRGLMWIFQRRNSSSMKIKTEILCISRNQSTIAEKPPIFIFTKNRLQFAVFTTSIFTHPFFSRIITIRLPLEKCANDVHAMSVARARLKKSNSAEFTQKWGVFGIFYATVLICKTQS